MGWNPLSGILQRSEKKGPPDLEDLFKNFFSKKKKRSKDNPFNYSKNSNNQPPNKNSNNTKASSDKPFWILSLGVIAVIVIIWAISGFFTVQQYEQGVILRFGRYERTVTPGIHWMARIFETKYIRNIQQQNNFPWPIQPMLTEPTQSKKSGSKQSQLVDVSFNIQWKINNLKDFLFNVDFPQTSLKESIDSSIRQVVGQTSFNDIISTDRANVQIEVKKELIELMSKYKTGIEIMSVNMQQAIAPGPVRDAFQDLVNAPQDQETTINKAEIYKNNLLPVAMGLSKRITIEAEAEKQNLILTAKANTAQYKAVLSKYKIAPDVTGNRLYFDTLQKVLGHSKIMLVDNAEKGGGNSNVFYLPLTPGQVNANGNLSKMHRSNSNNTLDSYKSPVEMKNKSDTNNKPGKKENYNRWEVTNS